MGSFRRADGTGQVVNNVNADMGYTQANGWVEVKSYPIATPTQNPNQYAAGALAAKNPLGGLIFVALFFGIPLGVLAWMHIWSRWGNYTHPPRAEVLGKMPSPTAVSTSQGWKVFNGPDLTRASTAGAFMRAIHIDGNVLVKGNLDSVKIESNSANFRVEGAIINSSINISSGGSVTATSIEKSSGISIKGNGSITAADVSHSTLTAKHLNIQSADTAWLTCATLSGALPASKVTLKPANAPDFN